MKIVADYPAYTVIDRKPATGVQTIKAGEILGCGFMSRRYGIMYRQFKAGSVVSYALESGGDPIEAVQDAQKRGEKMHWINATSTSITAHQRAKYEVTLVEEGQLVRFEGRTFKIVKAPNENLDLQEV